MFSPLYINQLSFSSLFTVCKKADDAFEWIPRGCLAITYGFSISARGLSAPTQLYSSCTSFLPAVTTYLLTDTKNKVLDYVKHCSRCSFKMHYHKSASVTVITVNVGEG